MRARLLAAALAAAAFAAPSAAAPSAAAPDAPVRLADMTWTEVRDAVAAGRTTVIIPVGGTEQSGPQLALGKHNVRADVLGGRIAEALGNALLAPVVAYVPEGAVAPPGGHMRFAGTISVPDAAFQGVLAGAARSFRQHGFTDVVLLGDHGGYQAQLAAVASLLNREWARTPARAHFIADYYGVTRTLYVQSLGARGLTAAEIGEHAGAADTSLMLAVDPSLVRPRQFAAAARDGRAAGVDGDPRRSTAALGQVGVDLVVGRSVAAIRAAVAARP